MKFCWLKLIGKNWLICAGGMLLSVVGALADTDRNAPGLTLDTAIRHALGHNFNYRIAATGPQIAESAIAQQRGVFDPEIFASGQIREAERATTFTQTTGTSTSNRNVQAGARVRLDTGTTVTASTQLNRSESNAGIVTSNLTQEADIVLSIRQSLLSGFGRDANRAGLERARAGLTVAEENFRSALLQVIVQTEVAYWRVARWQQQYRLGQSNLRVAEALLEEAKARFEVGLTTRLEVLQAEASRAQRVEELILAERNLEDSWDELFLIMGRMNRTDVLAVEEMPEVALLPDYELTLAEFGELWQRALAQDPGLAAQEAVIRQQEWNRKAAASQSRPNLDLVVSGGLNGIDNRSGSTAFGNAVDADGHSWSVGLEFSMPWGRRAERASLRIAELQLDREELRYEAIRQELYRELRMRYRALLSIQKTLTAAELTVALQEATFEQETSKYEEGLTVFRDVLQAQRDLDQARIRLLQARFQQTEARIELDRLTDQLLQRHGIVVAE